MSSALSPRREIAPGYSVPPLIVGLWQLSDGHRAKRPDPALVAADLSKFVDAGLDTFDCADIYTGVEELLGRVVRRHPPGAVKVHTKFVPDRDALATLDRCGVEAIIDRSLRRLGVERLDMVQFAWWDYEVPGYVEAAGWLDELRGAGKIRLLAATNFDGTRLAEILAAGVPLIANQVQYSLLDRRPQRRTARTAAADHMWLLCYGTLAGGFLSRRWLGRSDPGPPWDNRSLEKYRLIIDDTGGWEGYQALLVALAEVAERRGVSIANVATRWVLDQSGVAAALVGARDAARLPDNLNVLALTLRDEDRCTIDEALGRLAVPPGDVFELERVPGGPHGAIMRRNLNRGAQAATSEGQPDRS